MGPHDYYTRQSRTFAAPIITDSHRAIAERLHGWCRGVAGCRAVLELGAGAGGALLPPTRSAYASLESFTDDMLDTPAGFSIHREMHAFVRAGVPAADVLKMATINGARALNVSGLLGTIEVGKLADFAIVKGDPTVDIRITRSVHTVVKSGVVYDSAELLRSVEGQVGAN